MTIYKIYRVEVDKNDKKILKIYSALCIDDVNVRGNLCTIYFSITSNRKDPELIKISLTRHSNNKIYPLYENDIVEPSEA